MKKKNISNNSKSDNYLEYYPLRNDSYKYEVTDDGQITILKENKGLMNRLFQLFFKKPRISQIHLDKMGNFIWPMMDGTNSILDIASKVKEEFGDEAEPLYDRLAKYIKIHESYGFIIVNKDKLN